MPAQKPKTTETKTAEKPVKEKKVAKSYTVIIQGKGGKIEKHFDFKETAEKYAKVTGGVLK